MTAAHASAADPLPIGATLSMLRAHGYRADIQSTGQAFRCLVTFGAERWESRGPSPRAALEATFARMFPSAITRALARDEIRGRERPIRAAG